jgi:hypothetical protein
LAKFLKRKDFSLRLQKAFIRGEEATEEEVVNSLKDATIANLVGRKAIKCALDNGFIDEPNVIFVDSIPHAQIVKI